METFFLSFVNELCTYPRLFKSVCYRDSEQIMAQQTSMFYSWKCSLKLYWWSYVFPWKSALLQDSCQLYYGLGWLKLSQCYLKMHVVGEGPGATFWVLRHFLSLISSLYEKTWCWERLRAGGEEDSRGWDGWMASLTQWTWVWVDSGSWWWTGRPGMLWFKGSQRVGHDWVTELN